MPILILGKNHGKRPKSRGILEGFISIKCHPQTSNLKIKLKIGVNSILPLFFTLINIG